MHEGHRNRLRARLLNAPETCSEHELLELLLFLAIPRKNTNELAHSLINKFGSIANVFSATKEELLSIKGIGESAVSVILLYKYINNACNKSKPKKVMLNRNLSTFKYIKERCADLEEEVFFILCLDAEYKLKRELKYTNFNLHKVNLRIDEICRDIIASDSEAVIVFHNHLFGDAEPSNLDDLSTIKLLQGLSSIGVELIDHIICYKDKLFSYRSDGHLDQIKGKCNEEINKIYVNIKGDRNE